MIKPALKNLVETIHKIADMPAVPSSLSTPMMPTVPPSLRSSTMPTPSAMPAIPTNIIHQNKTPTTHSAGHLPAVQKMQSALQALSHTIEDHNLPVNMDQHLVSAVGRIQDITNFADGAWGPITDQALHRVYELAKLLVLVPEKFGLTNNIYQASNVPTFNNILSDYQIVKGTRHISLDADKQGEYANYLTEHLEAINKLYTFLIDKIPTTSNANTFNDKERQTIQTGNVLTTYKGQSLSVPLAALTNPIKYKEWLTSQKLDADPTAEMEILEALINQAARSI